MKRIAQIIVRGGILLVATLVVLTLSLAAFNMVSDGISNRLIANFEQDPVEGYDYWRWIYFKEHLFEHLVVAGILLTLAGLVAWGWVAFVRDVMRNHKLQS